MDVRISRALLVIAVVTAAGVILRAIPDLAYDNGRFDSVLDGALAVTMFIVAVVFFLSKRLNGDPDVNVCWAFAACGLIRFYGSAVDTESGIVWLHRLCSLSLAVMVYESDGGTASRARLPIRYVYLSLVGLATFVAISPAHVPRAVLADHRVAPMIAALCALSALTYGLASVRAYVNRAGVRLSIDERTVCCLALGIPSLYYVAYPIWSGQWWCIQFFELAATTYLAMCLLRAHLGEIARFRRELIQKTRHMERTLALVSHDIRNPLGVISTAAELIDGAHFKDVPPLLDKIRSNGTYINEMIQTLIESAGVIAGHPLELKYVESDLAEVIRSTVRAGDPAHVRRVHFEVDGGNLHGLWPRDLRRVVNNLLSNAFKYGRPDTKVRVRLWTEGERARLSVHNYGDPISVTELNKVFEPYHRLKAARERAIAGWGLGLSLVRNVVEAAGGRAWCDSDPAGVTFHLEFPRR